MKISKINVTRYRGEPSNPYMGDVIVAAFPRNMGSSLIRSIIDMARSVSTFRANDPAAA